MSNATATRRPSPLSVPNRTHTCLRIDPKGWEHGWIVLNGCTLPHRGYEEYDIRAGKALYKAGGVRGPEAFYMAMSRMRAGQWATQWYSYDEQVQCRSCGSRNGEDDVISSYVKVWDDNWGSVFAVGYCHHCEDLRYLNH